MSDPDILSALELDVLLVLTYCDRHLFGLEILQTINEARDIIGFRELTTASLYPLLERMKKRNLIIEVEVSEDLSNRKYWAISEYGADLLNRFTRYRQRLLEI